MAIIRDEDFNPIPQYKNSSTGLFEALSGVDGANDVRVARKIVKAGRATATTLNQIIQGGNAFNHISIINDGQVELKITIDNDSTISTDIVFIGFGEAFNDFIYGSTLNFSVVSGTTTFRYVLT